MSLILTASAGSGKLGIDELLNLSVRLKRGNLYQKPILCLKWSIHILEVKSNFSIITNPNSKKFDRCYELNSSFTDKYTKQDVSMTYSLWGELNNDDFVKVFVLDRDFINGDYVAFLKEKDLGGKTYEYEFT